MCYLTYIQTILSKWKLALVLILDCNWLEPSWVYFVGPCLYFLIKDYLIHFLVILKQKWKEIVVHGPLLSFLFMICVFILYQGHCFGTNMAPLGRCGPLTNNYNFLVVGSYNNIITYCMYNHCSLLVHQPLLRMTCYSLYDVSHID